MPSTTRPVRLAVCLLVIAAAAPAAAQGLRTIPLVANDLAYSPLTGRLYASVPATDSITEIDPVAGTVGVSFVVGDQPNRLAISDTRRSRRRTTRRSSCWRIRATSRPASA